MRKGRSEVAHKPLDKGEIEEGLRAEVLDLPEPLRRYFARVAVQVHQVSSSEFPDTPVFVVARSGDRAVFYDDVEEDFGIGAIDGDNRLKNCSLNGDLRSALLALQNG
jgi:hypothetical protein